MIMGSSDLRNVWDERRWILYGDGNSSFCDIMNRWFFRMDLSHYIAGIPYKTLECLPQGLPWNVLSRAAYLDASQSRLSEVFHAFRMMALRLLPLIPLAHIFWFSGMNISGEAVCSCVARNRFRLSDCRRVGE